MKNAIVTGANRGIGLELARGLSASGWSVFGACRSASPELRAIASSVWEDVDVAGDDLRSRLRSLAGDTPFQLLINCAGVLTREILSDLHVDQIRRQFEVNALGPLRVTEALQGNLNSGAKVVVISSRMGSIGDNSSGSRYGYRMSKAAANMAFVSLAHDLSASGIAVGILHPGFVRTDMTGGRGDWDAPEAAAALLERIDELSMANSGQFLHARGQQLPW